MSPAADWLSAIDDGLLGRPYCCTVCGQPGLEAWWDLATVGFITVAVRICMRCQANDPQRTQLAAVLQRRYSEGRPWS